MSSNGFDERKVREAQDPKTHEFSHGENAMPFDRQNENNWILLIIEIFRTKTEVAFTVSITFPYICPSNDSPILFLVFISVHFLSLLLRHKCRSFHLHSVNEPVYISL